jgi:hypothetical protein
MRSNQSVRWRIRGQMLPRTHRGRGGYQRVEARLRSGQGSLGHARPEDGRCVTFELTKLERRTFLLNFLSRCEGQTIRTRDKDSAAVIGMIVRMDQLLDASQATSNIRALPIGGSAKSPEKSTAIFASSAGGEVERPVLSNCSFHIFRFSIECSRLPRPGNAGEGVSCDRCDAGCSCILFLSQ